MTTEEQKDKCIKCEYSRRFCSHNFGFLGCTYGELKGKWVAELEKCPKESDKQ